MSALTLFTDQRTPSSDSLSKTLALAGGFGCCVLWTTCFSRSYSVQAIPSMLYQGMVLSLLQEGADYSFIALVDEPLPQKCNDKKDKIDRFARIAIITALSSVAIVWLSRIIAQTPSLRRAAFMLPPLSQTYWKVALVEATIRLWQATVVAFQTDSTPEIKEEEKEEEQKAPSILTPQQITAELDKHIIGQKKVKGRLSVAVSNHFRRFTAYSEGREPGFKKSNVFMIGPTGSGKTLLAETLAKIVKVPFTIADATTLTAEGYWGASVGSIINQLVQAADGDVKRAEWGIIYIDEIDKKRCHRTGGGTRDISGRSVQNELLKIVEGKLVNATPKYNISIRVPLIGKQILVNTHNILFIVGGAFVDLNKIIGKRLPSSLENNRLTHFKTEDLIKFGMIPEFIGRFTCFLALQKSSTEDLIRILTEPEGAPVKEFQALFNEYNIELEFEEGSLRAIAEKALELGTGARGLNTIVETLLSDMMFEAPSKPTITKIIVTEKSVTGHGDLVVLPESSQHGDLL